MLINWKNKIVVRFLLVLFGLLTLYLFFYLRTNFSNHLVINEVAFSQSDKVDWIEIYNPTMNNLSLKGMYLSDKNDNLSKFKIAEDIVVPSHSFVVFYGEGYEESAVENTLNFRIANGETVYLVSSDATTVVDFLTAVKSDDYGDDYTIGRFPDGANDVFIMSQASLGEANKKDMIGEMFR